MGDTSFSSINAHYIYIEVSYITSNDFVYISHFNFDILSLSPIITLAVNTFTLSTGILQNIQSTGTYYKYYYIWDTIKNSS